MAARKLLIMGGTGRQGGAVIDTLVARSAPFDILALTRNPSSAGARALASKPRVTVVQGDFDTVASVLSQHGPVYGVFLITPLTTKEETEVADATAVIDAAAKAGVKHLVFTSVDRGGLGKSEQNPTNITHFRSKHRIEIRLKERAAEAKMKWTILRPVGFMDNLTPDFMGKGFASLWATLGNKPMQLISCRDIGIFAARAFMAPEAYEGRAISLAGDDLTLAQAKEVFKKKLGYNMPETFGFVGPTIKFVMRELGIMFSWFRDEGYGANIAALREEEPMLQDFGTWLTESSKFRK